MRFESMGLGLQQKMRAGFLSLAARAPRFDVLVHNAGVAFPGRVAESTPEQWRATFEVNVTGSLMLRL